MFTLNKTNKFTFPDVEWNEHHKWYSDKDEKNMMYTLHKDDELVSFLILGTGYYQINKKNKDLPFVMEIKHLMTNPKYRRQGAAYQLLNCVFNDFIDNIFLLTTKIHNNDSANNLYLKAGFYVFFDDDNARGSICLAKITENILTKYSNKYILNLLADSLDATGETDDILKYDTEVRGNIWNIEEKRYINNDRTYYEEQNDMISNPYEIKFVKKQTLLLQNLLIDSDPDAFCMIKFLHPEIKDKLINMGFDLDE